ncbi:octopamine receptor beta-2R-like [Pomacea canaliculata]|uniref:octopamine receptor beta-2R-like n=1 Tax=Pomacea canaliculata TaxID=400727 RepID=UPI000D734F46|nr:octopamine receptor beta-2R-like [Pomacea canaliculata]
MVTGDSRIFVSMSRPNDPSRRLTTRLQMSSHVSMLGIQSGALGSRIHPDPGAGGEGFLFANTNIPHVLDGFDFSGTDVTGEEGLTTPGETTPSSWTVEQVCGVAVVAVIVPFILVSNLLVVVSVIKCKRLQVPTNYFIVSLAAVDIFVALVTPFVILVEILPMQFSNLVLCLTPNRILLTACGVSVLTLATIAYDRHTALVNPLEYVSVMTRRKIGLLVALTWLYSTAIVWVPLPAGWYSQPRQEEEEWVACSFKLHDNAHILFLSAIFGPACVAISICYFRIYTVARHHARAIAAVESSVQHNLRIRSIMKDAKYSLTLALVIGAFLALWLPYLTCLLAEVTSAVQVSPWLRNYLTLLAVLNSGLNPWIYAYKNNEFRSAFRKVFQDLCHAGAAAVATPASGRRVAAAVLCPTPAATATPPPPLSPPPPACISTVVGPPPPLVVDCQTCPVSWLCTRGTGGRRAAHAQIGRRREDLSPDTFRLTQFPPPTRRCSLRVSPTTCCWCRDGLRTPQRSACPVSSVPTPKRSSRTS